MKTHETVYCAISNDKFQTIEFLANSLTELSVWSKHTPRHLRRLLNNSIVDVKNNCTYEKVTYPVQELDDYLIQKNALEKQLDNLQNRLQTINNIILIENDIS